MPANAIRTLFFIALASVFNNLLAEDYAPAWIAPITIEYQKAHRSHSVTYQSPEAYKLSEKDEHTLQGLTASHLIAPWLGPLNTTDKKDDARYLISVDYQNVYLNAPLNPQTVRSDSYVRNSGRMRVHITITDLVNPELPPVTFDRKTEIGYDGLPPRHFNKVTFWQDMRQSLSRVSQHLQTTLPRSTTTSS